MYGNPKAVWYVAKSRRHECMFASIIIREEEEQVATKMRNQRVRHEP